MDYYMCTQEDYLYAKGIEAPHLCTIDGAKIGWISDGNAFIEDEYDETAMSIGDWIDYVDRENDIADGPSEHLVFVDEAGELYTHEELRGVFDGAWSTVVVWQFRRRMFLID